MIESIKNVLLDKGFISALVLVIGFIVLGFILRKTNIINQEGQKAISKLLLTLLIPAMAFDAFMCDFNEFEFKSNISVFLFAILAMILLFVIVQLILYIIDKNEYKVYSVMIILGQTTLFSIPILKTIFTDDKEVLITCNMITIVFRLFLYIYAYLVVSKTKIDKTNIKSTLKNVFLNPIMICMFLGLIIYLTQNVFFKVNIDGTNYSILRIDKTIPFVYVIISTLSKMTTPLAMFIVGLTLGSSNVKQAFSSKKAYLIALGRVIFVPLFVLLLVLFTNFIQLTFFSTTQIIVIILCFIAPLSAVVNTYCISFNNHAYLASDVCFLSSLFSIISIPLFYILINIIV